MAMNRIVPIMLGALLAAPGNVWTYRQVVLSSEWRPCSRISAKNSANAFAAQRNASGCLKPPWTHLRSSYLEMEQRWLDLARSYERLSLSRHRCSVRDVKGYGCR